jgi:hypothetical protein
MPEPITPGPGRSTSERAFSEVTKEVARRNEEAQKAARKVRAKRDDERRAQRREWARQ